MFLIQPLVPPVQEHLVELLLMLDAARGASAARITVVMPHYAYARSDKKDAPRISIGARLVADLLADRGRATGCSTMTLHSPQVHGFFSVPVDHLHALRELARHFRGVRPDQHRRRLAGPRQRQGGVAPSPGCSASRSRPAPSSGFADDKVVISSVIGDVDGRDVIVLDDEIAKGSTDHRAAGPAARARRRDRPGGLHARAVLRRRAGADRRAARRRGDRLHQHRADPREPMTPKLTVLSIAPALAEAMRRIHNGESVSALFDEH